MYVYTLSISHVMILMDYNKRVCFLLYFSLLLFFPHFSRPALRSSSAWTWRTDNQIKASVLKLTTGDNSPTSTFNRKRVTQLSWRPTAFIYKNFVTDEEGNHLIDLDEVVASIEARIAAWKFLPQVHFSPLPIDNWSDCAETGYAVKPKKGNTLLFYSLHPNASVDLSSYHGSCPAIEGEKWSATKWVHVRFFEESKEQATGEERIDEDEDCPLWAEDGECEINPLYMVGIKDEVGACRKSCNACSH